MSEDVFIDMLEDDFPAFQKKPAHKLNYTERAKAGLLVKKQRQPVSQKPRKTMRKVAKKKSGDVQKYKKWVTIELGKRCICDKCLQVRTLTPHHPFGREGKNLFKVTPLCIHCHNWCHDFPNTALSQGWLQPEYRGILTNVNHPKPFTLLPPP